MQGELKLCLTYVLNNGKLKLFSYLTSLTDEEGEEHRNNTSDAAVPQLVGLPLESQRV